MELNKTEFKNAVQRISAAIPKKAIIPNLCNVLFKSTDGVINLFGSDMNHMCHTSFKAEGVENISFTVNCEKLKKALSMRGEKITLNYINEPNEKVVINNGTTSVELECLPVHDYPAFSETQTSHTRTVSAKKFVDAVNKVKFAADKNGARVSLQGVYVNFVNNELQIFCTDGKRIAYYSEPTSELIDDGEFGFNLPMKSVEIINNLNTNISKDHDGNAVEPTVTISASETTVEFTQSDFTTVSKVITETPPVKSILDMINNGTVFKEAESSFKVNSVKISESLKFINSLCEQSSGINVSRNGDVLHFSVKNGSQMIDDEIEVENVKESDTKTYCNIQYLIEPISNFGKDEVIFEMKDPVSPFFIKADNFKYLLMPMRNN